MKTLNNHDSFIGGTEKQYKQIVKLSMGPECDKSYINFVVSNCVARGGLFWSSRVGNVVAGKLQSGQRYAFTEFMERLENRVKINANK